MTALLSRIALSIACLTAATLSYSVDSTTIQNQLVPSTTQAAPICLKQYTTTIVPTSTPGAFGGYYWSAKTATISAYDAKNNPEGMLCPGQYSLSATCGVFTPITVKGGLSCLQGQALAPNANPPMCLYLPVMQVATPKKTIRPSYYQSTGCTGIYRFDLSLLCPGQTFIQVTFPSFTIDTNTSSTYDIVIFTDTLAGVYSCTFTAIQIKAY